MDEPTPPAPAPSGAVVLDASDTDPRTRTGRDLIGRPNPALPVLGAVVVPDGHHLTVSYGTRDYDGPGDGAEPTGATAAEIEALVFVQTRHGRWLTAGAGRYREPNGTVIDGRGGASSGAARVWCWLHPRTIADVHLDTHLESSGADAATRSEVLSAVLLVDDPACDARLFVHVVDDPAVHVREAHAVDEHGVVAVSRDWRSHDADWRRRRAQIGAVLPPATPPT